MNLYKLSQDINVGYDTFDSCVVCAESEEEARLIHPSEYVTHYDDKFWYATTDIGEKYEAGDDGWVERTEVDKIKVEYIGIAVLSLEKGVIVASFNAG